ncbi:MAG: azurin/lysophospholipase L1-like esterase/glucose/arabinose dehydrogenase [Planctomycetota bacterium]|jgi:azurin/lysophospholipase L1-like esterase/glucose/arabinose dehydrogenase
MGAHKDSVAITMTSRFLPCVVPFLLFLASCGDREAPAASATPETGQTMMGHTAQAPVQDFFVQGDRVVVVGSGLADRLQHDGWMETYLQAELGGLDVSFRNQGYTGDRIDHRPRNKGFLPADDYLSLSQATVVFAMFGYNESFDGDAEAFGQAVTKWIEHTRAQNYSGAGAPRIVLFSPMAAQDLRNANLPNPAEQNARFGAYAAAMEQAAKAADVRFVDLFTPSLHNFTMAGFEQLTIDGVHLNEPGNRMLAKVISEGLYGGVTRISEFDLQGIRAHVLDKNWHWFNRYRATDGNDVWGSRAGLKFVDGQDNGTVLQHELVQLDVTTANRDKVIWAQLQGQSIQADDSNVPAPIVVISNLDKPQQQGGISKLGDGTYLGAEEAIDKMTLAKGLKANVFASEEMFPELVNPVQLGVDPRGRMWVAAWETYPKWEPLKEMNDRLLILPDDDGDGVADRAITFAKVHNPTGFEFWNGGVLVASAPELLFLKDTDGDDVADVRISLLGGIDSSDTHHTMNNFVLGPDGFLYYQRGVFNVSNVESPWQSNQQSGTSGMYRFNPRTFEFSFHASNSPNPHGISFDYWGYHYATDGTGGACYQVLPDQEGKFKMRKLLKHTVRPVASSGILSSDHFPPEFQGDFLLCNTIAFLGLKQYDLAFDTITGEVNGTETEDFLVSTDPNFRPTDFEIGNDGAMYVADWCNAIIGHMQHNVRDPLRDHAHGRIYRITAENRPLSEPVAVAGLPLPALLDLLQHPINGVRQRVRAELSGRDTVAVIEATAQWLESFDIRKIEDAHHMLEGLWVYQQHNIMNRELLKKLLNSPEAHARLAAQRVQYMWDHNHSKPGQVAQEETAAAVPTAPEGAIAIRTVMEEMRYEVESFTVTAGSPVKLWFYNPDYMPHNIVIGRPGSAESIGPAAEAMGADGFSKAFVPQHDQIIAASGLLNHTETELLEFTAPTQPGNYDFLCTFPGHWKLMRGTMIVE